MKKTIVLLVAVLMTSCLAAAGRAQVSLVAGILFPADSAFRETYGTSAFLPELKAAYSVSDRFYAWAGYGWISVSGETPVLKAPAESRQGFLVAGAGYRQPLTRGWSLCGELGLARIAYREEALSQTISGSALGFAFNAVVRRDLGTRFLLLAQLGYVYGKKTIDDLPVKMGGAKAGIGAGIRF